LSITGDILKDGKHCQCCFLRDGFIRSPFAVNHNICGLYQL